MYSEFFIDDNVLLTNIFGKNVSASPKRKVLRIDLNSFIKRN